MTAILKENNDDKKAFMSALWELFSGIVTSLKHFVKNINTDVHKTEKKKKRVTLTYMLIALHDYLKLKIERRWLTTNRMYINFLEKLWDKISIRCY